MSYAGLSEQQVERLKRAAHSLPFVSLCGIELESAEPGSAVMSLAVRDELKRDNGVVHGGAIATLIDTCTAFAIIPLLAEDEHSVTVDLTISYLRPLTTGTARASAKILREGRRVIVLSAEVLDHEGKLAATALSTYLRVKNR
jgi:uncharacterized protein (TIGR00369 family)